MNEMETHLRARLAEILMDDKIIHEALRKAYDLDLPDWWITSGAIYQTVWNTLSGKSSGHGIKDIDLIYFDESDLGYDAEDEVIRKVNRAFAGFGFPVEARNQARVHLWFEARFGVSYPRLKSASESLTFYAARTHAVAIHLTERDHLDIVAPFGLKAIFDMQLVPNPILDNGRTYAEKAARMKRHWPQLTIIPWGVE